jgi:hypothetical protein
MDRVGGVIDGVAVVAGAADQGVGAEAAVERVVAGEADEPVVAGVAAQAVGEVVAGERRGRGDGEEEVFDVGGERVLAAVAIDAVVALVGVFDHPVAGAEVVDVVAEAAGEDVGGAVGVPVEGVGAGVAGGVDGGAAGQVEAFEVLAEGPGDAAVDGVEAGVGVFVDRVGERDRRCSCRRRCRR